MAGTLIVDKIQLDVGNTFQVVGNTGGVILSANAASTVFAAGSAAAPSITTNGDNNTGIFFPAADTIAFAEGGVESARFDSSGNFSIGTTSTFGNSLLNVAQGMVARNSGAVLPYFQTYNSNAGTDLKTWRFGGNSSGALTFETVNDAYSAANERARIDANGTFFVGGTSNPGPLASRIITVANGLNGVEHFLCNEQRSTAGTENYFRFYRNNSLVGSITNTLSATAYNTSSDYRLKENVQPMTGALAKVAALKPCTYTWKVDGSSGQGFIAHELQAVVPDAVTGEKDAVNEDGSIKPQGIDTSFLIATLTAAIQEQQAMIKTLQDKVAALEAAQ